MIAITNYSKVPSIFGQTTQRQEQDVESPQLKLLFNNHVGAFSNLIWWQPTNPGCPFSNTILHPTHPFPTAL